jgi:uncharacterized protein YecT (DUF1311 family)
MRSKLFYLLFMALGSISITAHAKEIKISAQFLKCLDAAGGVTSATLECISTELKNQDSRLNKAYKELAESLLPLRKKELQETQRAWIKFRDANCNFYADPDGGSMAAISSKDCLLTTTKSRAEELEKIKEIIDL